MSEQASNKAGNDGRSITEGLPALTFRDIQKLDDPDTDNQQVYFLYCAGHVKIGVARSILRRMKELQIGAPWKAQIILLIPGGRKTESFLHFVFQEHRVRGEWFKLAEPIREAIKELAPPECQQWLAEDEAKYEDWIKQEAARLGFI